MLILMLVHTITKITALVSPLVLVLTLRYRTLKVPIQDCQFSASSQYKYFEHIM